MKNYNATIFESSETLETFYYKTFRDFRSVVETWEGYEKYLPKIDNLINNLPAIGRKLYTPNKPGHGYNVLNHGDFHLRNLLFKFDENKKIQDLLFVSNNNEILVKIIF